MSPFIKIIHQKTKVLVQTRPEIFKMLSLAQFLQKLEALLSKKD